MKSSEKAALAICGVLLSVSACAFSTPPLRELGDTKNQNSAEQNVTTSADNRQEPGATTFGIEQANAQITEPTTLEVVEGSEVLLKHIENGTYETVANNAKLIQGDFVKAGNNSRAEIHWADDSVTRMAPNTELKITTLTFDAEDPTNTNILFEVINGDTWNKALNIVNEKAGFSVQNGNVIAGVRGTTIGFTVQDGEVSIKALEHAIYLNDEDKTTLSEGDEATVEKQPQTGERPRVRVRRIAAEFYKTSWFAQNSVADEKINDRIKTRMFAALQNEFGRGPAAGAGAVEGIAQPKDPQTKAEALLKSANNALNEAIYNLSQDNKQSTEMLLQDYQDKIEQIKKLIIEINDKSIQEKLESKLEAQARLWAKYAPILFPDHKDISKQLEKNVLEGQADDADKKQLQKLYDTREFFDLIDTLKNTSDNIVREDISQRLNRLNIQPEDCRILLNIKDKLPNGEVPEKCKDITLSNANGNTGKIETDPVSLENSGKIFPNNILFNTLVTRIKNVECDNTQVATQIRDLLAQQKQLSPEQAARLQTQINSKRNTCISFLKNKIAEAQRQLESAKSQLNALPLSLRSSPAGQEITKALETINTTISKLKTVEQALVSL